MQHRIIYPYLGPWGIRKPLYQRWVRRGAWWYMCWGALLIQDPMPSAHLTSVAVRVHWWFWGRGRNSKFLLPFVSFPQFSNFPITAPEIKRITDTSQQASPMTFLESGSRHLRALLHCHGVGYSIPQVMHNRLEQQLTEVKISGNRSTDVPQEPGAQLFICVWSTLITFHDVLSAVVASDVNPRHKTWQKPTFHWLSKISSIGPELHFGNCGGTFDTLLCLLFFLLFSVQKTEWEVSMTSLVGFLNLKLKIL